MDTQQSSPRWFSDTLKGRTLARFQNSVVVILQVTLIVLFITLFFFLYATKVEHDVVVNQIDSLVSDLSNDITLTATPDEIKIIESSLAGLQPPNMADQDAQAESTNRSLVYKTGVVIGTVCVVGLLISGVIIARYGLPVWDIVKTCMAGLAAVCLIEFLFLTYFAKQYRSVDPNMVKLSIIQVLQNYANS